MLFEGLLGFSTLGYIGITLLLTHITIVAVTIFLHRQQSHHALELHPGVSHFFRFWLWLTTGMVTREWVAVHRKHHAKCETVDDPHSPRYKGPATVLFKGAWLYRTETLNKETLEKYGHGTPDDWVERHVYSRLPILGVTLMALIDMLMFGAAGIIIFAVQMAWIPFWAAGVINGIGHHAGYRNFETVDASTNILPWGILIGGEELHNNHHAYPSSAKLSNKWWEFDIGWMYIRLMETVRLARIKRVAPKLRCTNGKQIVDIDTVRAVVSNRFHIMKLYGNKVIKPVIHDAQQKADRMGQKLLQRSRKLMIREDIQPGVSAQETINKVIQQYRSLATVYRFKQQLRKIWTHTSNSQANRVQRLQAWCTEAEQTGIRVLEDFSQYLREYGLRKA
ncbi:MAG: acyl-CoA desaturase [Gammaproteobacteria bacterium]|nr:acyl-CoA desaturase [Gammaproteobacteria bacterium]